MKVETIRLPYPVPYYAQVASAELARAIFSEGMDAALDPRWAESGARDPQEYAYWTERACGSACVKMCVEALGGEKAGLVEWARRGAARGGYLVERGARGETLERGWIHRKLAELIEEAGFQARAVGLGPDDFAAHLRAGRMVIASASYELGDGLPVTRKGGHLVVVVGADLLDGRLGRVILHNPSGRSEELRAGASIAAGRFGEAFSGRGIVVER